MDGQIYSYFSEFLNKKYIFVPNEKISKDLYYMIGICCDTITGTCEGVVRFRLYLDSSCEKIHQEVA